MTGDTQLRVLAQHSLGIESRSVRVESAPSDHGMTRQAIPFHMAGDATFQRLPSRLSMSQEELSIPVVIAGRAQQGASSGQAGLGMAGLAEFADVVTVGAGGRAGVRVGGVPGQVARRVIAPSPRGVG